MEFDSNLITELTAPNTVPFEPGYDIIGFGSYVPPELLAIGIDSAIIFYTSDWDETAVTPRIKYYAIANNNGVIGIVSVGSLNPSTTPASITGVVQYVGRGNATIQSRMSFFGDTSNDIANIGTLGATGVNQGGSIQLKGSTSTPTAVAGKGTLYVSSTGQLVYRGPTTSTVVAPA